MVSNIFFKAYKYKNRTFCIKHLAAKTPKTPNIFGNFTNFIRFLLFEKERKSYKNHVFKFDVFRFLEKWA